MSFNLVVAKNRSGSGIGYQGSIPWECKPYDEFFKTLTTGSIVIMGRKTWETYRENLRGRTSVVISQSLDIKRFPKNVKRPSMIFKNPWDCVQYFTCEEGLKQYPNNKYVIGGNMIFSFFLKHKLIRTAYIGEIQCARIKTDITFPFQDMGDLSNWHITPGEMLNDETTSVVINRYDFINKEEQKLLDTIREITTTGHISTDENDREYRSKFGVDMKFNLRGNAFPLMGYENLDVKAIFEELKWLLSGHTDTSFLKYDTPWNLKLGKLGPTAGHLFRNYGAHYNQSELDALLIESSDLEADSFEGVDQLQRCIAILCNNPGSKRNIITLWDPLSLSEQSKVPSECLYQFYTHGQEVSCRVYLRECNMKYAGHSIASASLFLYLICRIAGRTVGDLHWSVGTAYVYNGNSFDFSHKAYQFPNVFVDGTTEQGTVKKNIEDYQFDDVIVIGYHPKI